MVVAGLLFALRRTLAAGLLTMVLNRLTVSLHGRIDLNLFNLLEVDVKDVSKSGLTKVKLRLNFFNSLDAGLAELGISRDLVMNIAALARMMATRIIVRVDHMVGSRTDSRVNFLGGHRNVIRVERSLVVMRVTVVRVPVGLVSLNRSGLGATLGVLVCSSLLTDKSDNQSDQNVCVHPRTMVRG